MESKTSVLPITIIIPVYNVKYSDFQECLESIACQNEIPGWLVIISDGCCDENIDKIVTTFEKKQGNKIKIKYIKLLTNHGISFARNIGMKYVRTPWVSFLDADDYIKENYFERLYQETNNVDIVACSCYAYDGKNFTRNQFLKKIAYFMAKIL